MGGWPISWAKFSRAWHGIPFIQQPTHLYWTPVLGTVHLGARKINMSRCLPRGLHGLLGETDWSTTKQEGTRKEIYLLNICWRPGSMLYALSALLYLISFTDQNTEFPREYLLTQILKSECSIVGWALRFFLLENHSLAPLPYSNAILKELK